MNTLILNPGSRWLKAKVYSSNGEVRDTQKIAIDDTDAQDAWFSSLEDITKIGLRVVHGGDMESPRILDKITRKKIEQFSVFAPLHNAKALTVADRAIKHFSDVPIWCVFDTHFHRTLPAEAYTYPIPKDIAEKYAIRRYGFHGIALESVLEQLQKYTEEKRLSAPEKVILVHLGGGSSITAVQNGRSVATSMGATPLEGVMMITRSGSIDPDIPRILNYQAKYDSAKISKMLNDESGFQGLVGSTDTKQIIESAMRGSEPEKLAFSLYVRSIVEYIFSYYGLMQGTDVLVFSGGIGFNNEYIVGEVLKKTNLISLSVRNTYVFQADETKIIFDYLNKSL